MATRTGLIRIGTPDQQRNIAMLHCIRGFDEGRCGEGGGDQVERPLNSETDDSSQKQPHRF